MTRRVLPAQKATMFYGRPRTPHRISPTGHVNLIRDLAVEPHHTAVVLNPGWTTLRSTGIHPKSHKKKNALPDNIQYQTKRSSCYESRLWTAIGIRVRIASTQYECFLRLRALRSPPSPQSLNRHVSIVNQACGMMSIDCCRP